MQTEIQVADDKILIRGPYSETNNAQWRRLGGKFAGGNWVLPDTDHAREVVADLFGSRSEEVDVLVPADRLEDDQIVQVGGYVLAQRRGRDYRVQMPEGVALESGEFRGSCGSRKNPLVGIYDGMVFRLRCRRSFAEANRLEIAPDRSDRKPSIEV